MSEEVVATVEEVKEPTTVKVDVLTDVPRWQWYQRWPYEDNSVDEITCAGVFEFIEGRHRGTFMEEVYRVLKPEGKAAFAVPYWNTWRGIYDYRFEMPPLCEQSFLMFDKQWREATGIKVDLVCDFPFTYGHAVEPETAARDESARSFYIKHYTNCVDALHLMLTKRV